MNPAVIELEQGTPWATGSHAERWLDAGLAVAARHSQLTYIALSAPVAAAAPVIDAFRDEPLVSWTSGEITVVGIGTVREIRGVGSSRWDHLIEAAQQIATTVDQRYAVIDGEQAPFDAIGFARPRFIGGAAFSPGSADRAPWIGFGDAWFALPRWTYVHDGVRACIVLAVDARDAMDADRWRAELARLRAAIGGGWLPRPQPTLIELERADNATWRDQVTSITDAISQGRCSKIVAARTCAVSLAGPVHASALLDALDREHADCARVLIKPPGAGTLIAATPERLVRRDGEVVMCDALAGSISRGHALGTAELLASTKDRREHELVVQAIRMVLEGTGARVDAPAVPCVRTLRHVLHLHTPFRAVLREPTAGKTARKADAPKA